MNKRHIQTFLTVSAAFFAISAPLRSNAAEGTAEAMTRTTTHITPCQTDMSRSLASASVEKDGQKK
ncbi:hypothetical protein [Paraburkholderia flava]|uniref:hypothetical protein n=1 Tax=Paraburkholderia flava TaxID=2547393 RepID=UPI00105CF7D9|nr:hypothetical protein [Paraburkholderia flava]